MAGKRNAAYYKVRLRRDHPTVYADLGSGKYPSVRAAAAAAGLIHLPTRVDALKREWRGATDPQRIEFVKWLKAGALKLVGAGAIKSVAKPIADAEGRLRSDVKMFLAAWVKSRKLTPGRIMKEIGFKGFDYTLSAAIAHGHPLRSEVIPKLTDWLLRQGFR